MSDSMQLEAQYCAHNYHPLPVVLTRGEGVFVWDENGKKYLDMMSAYSAVSHGHANPRLVRLVQEQVAKLNIVSRAFHTDRLGPFLARACEITGMDMALPMNTGAEAVETAIKAARKWAYTVKGVPDNRAEIIGCDGNFHGRTIAAVAMSDEPQYQYGFGPFPPGFLNVEYGDIDALAEAINDNTAAFIVEPIQGEGGIIIPPEGYLRSQRAAHRR
jgi:ornithine--oxo-acid transaminase